MIVSAGAKVMKSTKWLICFLAAAAALATLGAAQSSPGGRAGLAAHNRYRAKHGAAPLTWDKKLEDEAYRYATKCNFSHDKNRNGAGENLFVSGDTNEDKQHEAAANSW